MTTATFGEVAKLIGTNVDRLRENDKVCLFCDAIQLVAIMIAPLLLPIGIIYASMHGGLYWWRLLSEDFFMESILLC